MEGDMNPTVLAAMKAQKEWAKAVAFNQEGKVIAATAKPLDGEIAYVSASTVEGGEEHNSSSSADDVVL
ncbi:hypothetical protein DYB31_016630 [Aphanomyces astaci]|uniref:Uncharacterized protein n=1 Tax=Aphanomyces astaci TaxID=112090 RepID=A0A397EQ10_APHAT|nr:hypothetical protein DYB31_016630 [Aphanomyces astaci]